MTRNERIKADYAAFVKGGRRKGGLKAILSTYHISRQRLYQILRRRVTPPHVYSPWSPKVKYVKPTWQRLKELGHWPAEGSSNASTRNS
jgi:hypothetical protein